MTFCANCNTFKYLFNCIFTLSLWTIVPVTVLLGQSFQFTLEDPTRQFESGDFSFNNVGEVVNLDSAENELEWIRYEHYLPDGWQSTIGDKYITYLPFVDTQPLTLDEGEDSPLQVTIYTEGLPGDSAVVELCVQEVGDSATAKCQLYTFYLDTSPASPSFEYKPEEATIVFNPDSNLYTLWALGYIYYYDTATTSYTWIKKDIYLPEHWECTVVNHIAEYFPERTEGYFERTWEDSSVMHLHLYRNDHPGDSAIVELCIQELLDSTTRQCETIRFISNKYSTVADVQSDVSQAYLYPNPCKNILQLAPELECSAFAVYSVRGILIDRFECDGQLRYNTEHLTPGLYYLRVFNKQSKSSTIHSFIKVD